MPPVVEKDTHVPDEIKGLNENLNRDCRLRNLELANAVRFARADVKNALQSHEMLFDEFLDDTPECCLKVQIGSALSWIGGIGVKRSNRICDRAKVSPFTPVQHLTKVQKYSLYRQVEYLCQR